MGAHLARRYLWDAEVEPEPSNMPAFDPLYGFPERKERVMIATQQQMNDAQLPMKDRDYCAHYLIKFLKCKRDKFPNIFACKHERHDWDYCEHLDYVMRMKEFERERRLLTRKKRIEQKEKAAAAAAS
ncbi:NADH dehydrogenase [ubiquinone] 1 beta subcomplex subunit 7 isoform X1 [Rhineura floridana]|uniref:NADH dehydrogenase [ubiquinone] 1 beta subcomplex subunit 7 isoform X1 n=1 Tax=Rhineura floridana TaxID=261503 RepID=UPI002AC84EB4|nr:NADH dehydrogenase [ubiquinone] 1 beta subcomplex subunit 7 isoform X1 [Rhineura floridana]